MKQIIRFLLQAAIGGLLLVHLLAALGEFSWFFDLFNHFRLQYLWISALLALGTILFIRQKRWLVVALCIFLFNLWNIGIIYLYRPQSLFASTPKIKIMFSNILVSTRSDKRVGELIEKEDPDIIFLAEIRQEVFDQLQERLGPEYQVQEYRRRFGVFGMAVFSKIPFENNEWQLLLTAYLHEDPLPSFTNVIRLGNKRVRLIEIHPYHPLGKYESAARNETFVGVADYLEKNQDIPVLVIGDFNSTSWSREFQAMQKTGKLSDSRWGHGLQPSWPTQLPPFMRISIDHALYTEGIQVHERYTGPDIGSDHLPIFLTISVLE